MGGSTAINSFAKIPEIDGLISMSAYSSWEDVFSDNMIGWKVPRIIAYIQKPFMKLHTTFKYRFGSFNNYPKHQIKYVGERPALIMHSTNDSEVPISNFNKIMKNAPDQVESWVREGDAYFIVQRDKFLTPYEDKEYSKRIINFLNKNF